jgi:hypothetical protein
MVYIYTQISWYNMGGDGGWEPPMFKGVYSTDAVLGYMRGFWKLWKRVRNKTDMPKKYRNWKYTDRYHLHIFAKMGRKVIPLQAPHHWSEEEQKEYAQARDFRHLLELHTRFEKNFVERVRAANPYDF